MSGRPVPFGLYVRFGRRIGSATEPAVADFTCPCGFSDAASGEAEVSRFVATVAAEHRKVCRLRRESRKRG